MSWEPLRRSSLLSGNKIERCAVDTKPFIGWWRAVLEDVAQMSVTLSVRKLVNDSKYYSFTIKQFADNYMKKNWIFSQQYKMD